jgi:hypothetical protein
LSGGGIRDGKPQKKKRCGQSRCPYSVKRLLRKKRRKEQTKLSTVFLPKKAKNQVIHELIHIIHKNYKHRVEKKADKLVFCEQIFCSNLTMTEKRLFTPNIEVKWIDMGRMSKCA